MLSVDDTHNTNRFKMNFFDIVGIDSEGKSVLLAQALLDSKETASYEWVFEQLKEHGLKGGLVPATIMSDGDLAIACAVAMVFPPEGGTQHMQAMRPTRAGRQPVAREPRGRRAARDPSPSGAGAAGRPGTKKIIRAAPIFRRGPRSRRPQARSRRRRCRRCCRCWPPSASWS